MNATMGSMGREALALEVPTRADTTLRGQLSCLARRVSNSGWFALEMVARRLANNLPTYSDFQHASWVAENLCAIHGIDVTTDGMLRTPGALLVFDSLDYLSLIAGMSLLPGATVLVNSAPRHVPERLLRSLGVWSGDNLSAQVKAETVETSLARGLPVLMDRATWRRLQEELSADYPVVAVSVSIESHDGVAVSGSWAIRYLRLATECSTARVCFGEELHTARKGMA